ncbi:MAG: U32 family peptidase [Halanaerobiales bacterium]|nr:U32 family peptidase [Halanaerobiales bacterium]
MNYRVKPELLAPVGNMESLYAAVQNGCDAVYLGGKSFGARAYAQNFNREELQKALDYAHLYGVKIYVTINTLYKDKELSPVRDFIGDLYDDGVDGVILQDLGLAQLIRQTFPDLELHASTQMTIHNLDGAKYLEELGFSRVVLARELSIEEIKEIVEGTSLEVETFIHGALCVSYSGQCLMSSLIGGRSGNRGRCAQPCRLPYTLMCTSADDKNNKQVHSDIRGHYLLSPKDISTLDILPSLIRAGIRSLKIEGRMKRSEYAAAVTKIYRKYIDLALKNSESYQVSPEDIEMLHQIFNRGGFSDGYYMGKKGSSMMSYLRPKNWGIRIGEVVSYDSRRNICKIKLTGDLESGDGIEIWTDQGENPGTQIHSIQFSKGLISVPIRGKVMPGDPVYRTSKKSMLDELSQTFSNIYQRKIDLFGKIRLQPEEVISFELRDQSGICIQVESDEKVERAKKQPLSKEKVEEQISKLGNQPFCLVDLSVEMNENIFVPISKLNALRRKAVDRMIEARISKFRNSRSGNYTNDQVMPLPDKVKDNSSIKKELAVYLKGPHFEPSQFINLGVHRLYLDLERLNKRRIEDLKKLSKEEDVKIFAVLPRIAHNDEMIRVKEKVNSLEESLLDGFIVGNLGEAEVLKDFSKPYIVDYSLNVFNHYTLDYWQQTGANSVTISPELNLKEIGNLVQWGEIGKDVIVYGYLPAMISSYCPIGAVEGGMTENRPCSFSGRSKASYVLRDRKRMDFPILTDCRRCQSVILNSRPLFLLEQLEEIMKMNFSVLRMDLTIENQNEGLEMVRAYLSRLKEPIQPFPIEIKELVKRMQKKGFTKGHFYRGVE